MDTKLTIREAAARTGLSVHTLRYYERIGLLGAIGRSENGHRHYSTADLGWIDLLKRLRATGMSIALMQRYADLQRGDDPTFGERLALLEMHRDKVLHEMEMLQAHLEVIAYKIDYYSKEKERLESCKES